MGTSSTLVCEYSSSLLYFVGISCPSMSSFNIVSWRYLNSKCVVMISELGSSAGCCTGEVVYFIFTRNDDDSSGVLTCSTFCTETSVYKPVHFRAVHRYSLAFKEFRGESPCGFVCKSTDCSCFEGFSLSEEDFREFMRVSLHISGEVEVDIRRFVSLESEECFKRDIVSVLLAFCAAFRAVFRR